MKYCKNNANCDKFDNALCKPEVTPMPCLKLEQSPETPAADVTLNDLLCATTCVAEKGGDLCSGECAKGKIENLFKYLDSFEYENDVVTVARVKQSLDQST